MGTVVVRAVLALISAAAGAWLAWLQLPVVSLKGWVVALAAVALAWVSVRSFSADVAAAWAAYRVDTSPLLRRNAHAVLSATLMRLVWPPTIDTAVTPPALKHKNDLDLADVGLNAFVVMRSPAVLFRRRLVRLARVRLTALPEADRIRWLLGKGVIGRVWRDKDFDVVDTQQAWSTHVDCSKAQWKALRKDWKEQAKREAKSDAGPASRSRDNDVTLGLTYSDFQALRKKYRGAAAVPVKGPNQRVIGVVALDLKYDSRTPVTALAQPAILAELEGAASRMADDISLARGARAARG